MSQWVRDLLSTGQSAGAVVEDPTGVWDAPLLLDAGRSLADHLRRRSPSIEDHRHGQPVIVLNGGAAASVVAMLAAQELGAVVAHLDPDAPDEERDAVAVAVAASWVCSQVSTVDDGDWASGGLRIRLAPGRSPRPWPALEPGAQIFLTSGSTGRPKGVVRSGRAVCADARRSLDVIGVGAGDVVLNAAPVFHVYGQSHGLLMPLLAGARSVHVSARLLPSRLAGQVARVGARVFVGVPTHIHLIASGSTVDFGPLAVVVTGTAPLPGEVVARAGVRLGCQIRDAYGSTETGVLSLRRVYPAEPDADVVTLLPGIDARLRPLPDNDTVGGPVTGEPPGLLGVTTDALASAYLVDGQLTTLDGAWYETGDVVSRRGERRFQLLGRLSRMINVAGEKVDAAEIERVLLACPGVRAAYVTSAADGSRGQVPIAYVAADPNVSAQGLRDWCVARLAPHKVPRHFEHRADLRLSATGKTRPPVNEPVGKE
jgi:acyl-coenzyme A synthetase/AMP-(fatty) acid ligase